MRDDAMARVGSCLVLASAEVAPAHVVCLMQLALLARPLGGVRRTSEGGRVTPHRSSARAWATEPSDGLEQRPGFPVGRADLLITLPHGVRDMGLS
jgi:hypothetical protein